jgi:hypothetical protein
MGSDAGAGGFHGIFLVAPRSLGDESMKRCPTGNPSMTLMTPHPMTRALTACFVLSLTTVSCGDSASTTMSTVAMGGSATTVAEGGTAGSVASGGANTGGDAAMANAGMGGAAEAGGSSALGGMSNAGGMGGMARGGQGGSGEPEVPEDVPDGYELVYSEDFSVASAVDDFLFANPGDWAHSGEEGGFLETTGASYGPPQASPHTVAILDSLVLSSFVMDVELWQTSGDGDAHRDMCVFFNFESPSRFYYAHISTQHDGVAHNLHIVSDADRTAISATFTDGYDWGRDEWKPFRVIRDAALGTMSIIDLDSDTTVLSATDTTFASGYIGFGSFDNTGRIGSVSIWAPESSQVPADFGAPFAPLE